MGKWTRRAFISAGIVAGGGVLVGVAIRPGNLAENVAEYVEGENEKLVHAYVKIGSDNVVTAIIPHAEMGQGAQTALAQMLADELDADWNLIRIEEAPALPEYAMHSLGRGLLLKNAPIPDIVVPTVEGAMMRMADSLDLQVTGGSMSVRVTGQYGMRVAGAATKEMLKRAAAKSWSVPRREVETENSMLIHKATQRAEPYAQFAEAAAKLTPSYTPKLKTPKQFKIMGQVKPRLDLPAKVDGTAKFAIDVRLPNMVYATVTRAPVYGAKVAEIDDRAVRAIKGVLDVVRTPSSRYDGMIGGYSAGEAVAVIADSYWTAKRGLDALKITWESGDNDTASSATIREQHNRAISEPSDRQTDHSSGNASRVLSDSDQILSADYGVPYLAHTCMEPLNATAEFKDGNCEVWIGCQNLLGFKRSIADALGLEEDQVKLNNLPMGGGFGRKSRGDWAIQAAHIAKAVGRPVQLIWSREEDVRQDFYRPASVSRFRAALGEDGFPTAWENTYVNKLDPAEAPLIPYAIDAQDIGHVLSESHVPLGAWRSVDESQHGFYTECFIDECAVAAGVDPFKYRAELVRDKPRHLAVLERAAKEADWHKTLKAGHGRGIALKESFGSIVAEVAEVHLVNGEVVIDRVVAVIDPGYAIAPDGVVAQIESGIIYGLTAAIYGEITIKKGAAVESNFHDYQALRISAAPPIETHIINSGHDLGGVGEPGTPPAAPALANAIFSATGQRLRELPLGKHIPFARQS